MRYNKGIPSKMDFYYRLNSQSRALDAGFDEVGLGTLFGLNDRKLGAQYEILALRMHSDYIKKKYNVFPMSLSFPRRLPSKGVSYKIPQKMTETDFVKLICVARLAMPMTKLVITCRESANFRRRIRPAINIEDYEARPGPCGNLLPQSAVFQMEIKDKRSGRDIFKEMQREGYKIC
jgi:2-iminoacetate synthase